MRDATSWSKCHCEDGRRRVHTKSERGALPTIPVGARTGYRTRLREKKETREKVPRKRYVISGLMVLADRPPSSTFSSPARTNEAGRIEDGKWLHPDHPAAIPTRRPSLLASSHRLHKRAANSAPTRMISLNLVRLVEQCGGFVDAANPPPAPHLIGSLNPAAVALYGLALFLSLSL